jgi:cell division protein FtsL
MAEVVSKRIAVTRVVRVQEKAAPAKGVDRNLVFVAMVVALVFLACSLVYVWSHHQIISLGYEISKAGQEEQTLSQENKKLRLELAGLKTPGRIETMALNELGFINPQKDQLIIVR